tara:strand:- start:207 stop:485 length:279 start_codon:yes stop_codon:yes gene_type:complete
MANAATAGVGVIRVTPVSTSAVPLYCTVNLFSTYAGTNMATSSVSSGSINASTNISYVVPDVGRFYQVTGGSTGFSVAAQTSGWISVEMWKK